jgi:hypothetical protein
MTTMQPAAGKPMRRLPPLPLTFSALAAFGILLLAAAWPGGGEAPSVLSRAAADPPLATVVPASPRLAWSQGTSVPDAATAFAGPVSEPEEPAPTF